MRRRAVLLIVLLAAVAVRGNDIYSGYDIQEGVVLSATYKSVWRMLAQPQKFADTIFRNIGVSAGNHSGTAMDIQWPHGYGTRLIYRINEFARTLTYEFWPTVPRDDVYPPMYNMTLQIAVSPLRVVYGKQRSMVSLAATASCASEGHCAQLRRIWQDQVYEIGENLRFKFGAPCTQFGYSKNGACNNLNDYALGASFTVHPRLGGILYADGIGAPNGASRPNPRVISNAIVAQGPRPVPNRAGLNHLLVIWGQLIDHELTFFQENHPGSVPMPIPVPKGDPDLDPTGTGTVKIPFTRSQEARFTGTSRKNPRQVLNTITAYIDGSFLYGSTKVRHLALREFKGGRLLVSEGNFLPFNNARFPNADAFIDVPPQARPSLPVGRYANASFFLAGDVRVNENVLLAAMHTLLVREHNRVADKIAAAAPTWSDDQVFEWARLVVAAEMQYIIFEQFVPSLLGRTLPPYRGYDPSVDPSIDLVFSTAFFRIGHTLLPSVAQRLGPDLKSIPEGPLSLKDSFFAPHRLLTEGGMDPVFRGMLVQHAEEVDQHIVDELRSFLFGPPGSGLGGSDLASINIQRGRDHAIPDYNHARQLLGLSRVRKFSQITSNATLARALEQTYGDVNNVDLWIGMLCEDHAPNSPVGPLLQRGILRQMAALRDGDRFYYRNVMFDKVVRQALGNDLDFALKHTARPDVLLRMIAYNTGIDTRALPISDAFHTRSTEY